MKNLATIIAFSVILSLPLVAQKNNNFPDKPYAWVNDYTDLFNPAEEEYLNNKLNQYGDTTSTQIFVVSIDDHGNMPISQMGAEIGEAWKVGQEGDDNGMIILIYPTDRKMAIQVGYGLEEFIPDAIAKRIIEKEIKPSFQSGNYVLGIDRATDVIFSLLSGEFTGEEYSSQSNDAGSSIFGVLFLILMFVLFFGQSRRGRQHGIGRNVPFWIALSMLSGSRNTHSGGFGNFNSGSGGFGGFSGGGGGSFGGGGASGSW